MEEKKMYDVSNDGGIMVRITALKNGWTQFTDATNAYRLYVKYGTEIRYNAKWKKWLVWNNGRWETDSGALVHDRGLKMIRGIFDEIWKTASFQEQIEIQKFAIASESVHQREAFVKSASWMPALNVKSEDLDKNNFLLNVENGTVDVTTGEFKEHLSNEKLKMKNEQ
jgi:putative DNA primase/helicase